MYFDATLNLQLNTDILFVFKYHHLVYIMWI